MLKIILFSFMENGYLSLRAIEKSCKADLRYLWLLDGMKAPTYQRADNVDPAAFVSGRGHHKTPQQRRYQQLQGYRNRLKRYAEQISSFF